MIEHLASSKNNRQNEVNSFWECRYFVLVLPRRFMHKELKKTLGPRMGPFNETDVYLISSDARMNIKIRNRSYTIKIKVLLEREEDGFELWQDEFELRLPYSTEKWHRLLQRLNIKRDIQLLSGCSHPDQVLEILCNAQSDIKYVKTSKSRTFYKTSTSSIEITEVFIDDIFMYSVSFKSLHLAEARAIRNKLPIDELGAAMNYVDLCSQILLGKYR